MESMTSFARVEDALLRHVVLYCAELVFIAVYLALIYNRFALSGATLLAFVISSQATLFQAKCISSPLFIFGFPLLHNGNDAILAFWHCGQVVLRGLIPTCVSLPWLPSALRGV